jgi:hypothetical protein
MSDSEDLKKNLPAPDGFDDAEDRTEGEDEQHSRVIQGERLVFTNEAKWLIGGDEEFPKDRELVVVDTVRVVQKWIDQRPVGEPIFVESHQKWPNVNKLNEACPKSEWTEGPDGKLRGPWQRQRVVYLVDLKTMEKFTYPTGTVGGDVCIREFRDKVAMMRRFKGERVFAVVTLGDKYMPTRWGGRQRPELVIKRWIRLGPDGTALPTPAAPSAPPSLTTDVKATPAQHARAEASLSDVQEVEEPTLSEQMGDAIDF